MLKLIDARERFLQNILTFATTVTLGVPTLIKAVFNKSDFSSPFVYLAFAAFVIVLILWLVARGSRSLRRMGREGGQPDHRRPARGCEA